MKRHGLSVRTALFLLAALFSLSAAGCATPVGVERVSPQEAYREININALNRGEASGDTKVVLQRYDLVGRFDKDPAAALATLRAKVRGEDDRRDLRFAIAELEFLYAGRLLESEDPEERRRAADHFLDAAGYAYSYLLGDSREDPPGPYDRRFRVACDLYNRALGRGLATGEGGRVDLRGGDRMLPAGLLTITPDTSRLPWPVGTFDLFLLADEYTVQGLTVRNRTPGMGVPMIAVQRKTPDRPQGWAAPVTAFLRISRERDADGEPRFKGTLELYSAYEETEAEVDGRKVPLETDSTVPFAYMLDNPYVWKAGLQRFLKLEGRVDPGIKPIQPYLPGRIPVVFVHGTASSQVWWAEMINTLRSDPVLRKRYQFWLFQYNSGVPVTISAAELRRSLTQTVKELDPDGRDTALKRMVVIGHSQGGLLTRMTVVRTGDRLWRTLSDDPLEDAPLDTGVKERLREYLFIEPLPFVTRVVYIATPHRGSYLAGYRVRNLVRRFVRLPLDIAQVGSELFQTGGNLKIPLSMRGKIPTSVDGMSPENPVLQALVSTPLEPGVKAHSIIAVKGEGDYREGNDGVVEYKSAHLEEVESEFIVRSGHSCQGHPLTIEEVRRILLEHIASPSAEPAREGMEKSP